MSKLIYIHQHLGLGDHFHCNGVIRYLLSNNYKNRKVRLFAKEKYFEMIKFMYRDLENLEIIPITNDEKSENEEVNSFIKEDDEIEKIGFDYFVKNKDVNKTIDMLFYEQFRINYDKRFELTYWKRDTKKEEELYKKLVYKDDYIFVHDDASRGFVIPEKFIKKNYQIIRNSYQYSIFDYSGIIEKAKEIHVMESSARCMLEYLNTKNSKHFLYNFINGPWKSMPFYNEKNEIVGSSKNWEIINVKFRKKNFIQKIFNL